MVRKAEAAHRLDLLDGPMWTYVTTGPVRRRWGFHTEQGWVHWSRYLAAGVAVPSLVMVDRGGPRRGDAWRAGRPGPMRPSAFGTSGPLALSSPCPERPPPCAAGRSERRWAGRAEAWGLGTYRLGMR